MNRVKKALKALIEIGKNPWLLNHILSNDARWENYLKNTYKIPQGLPVLDISELSDAFSETLECFSFLDGGSLPTDIALLKALSKRFEKCSYFEIGTWRGESVVNVADVAEECYTLNLSEEEMHSLGWDKQYIDLHGFFSKGNKKITHLTGNSLTFNFSKLNKKFDLIFIDGNHHYEYVKNDTKKVFKHLAHDDSIIVWHDYAYTPEKVRAEVLAGILDGTPPPLRKHLYHVSNTMCAIFIKGEYTAGVLHTPVVPTTIFKVKVEAISTQSTD